MNVKFNGWVGIIVIAGVILLLALPFLWQAWLPCPACGRMGYGPMMRGYYPMHGMMYAGGNPYMMVFSWVFGLGVLAVIGLSIAALIKYLRQ